MNIKIIVSNLFTVIIAFPLFSQQVKSDNRFEGYLFAYFEGKGEGVDQEQLRFAISEDAIYWYALNENHPIIPSSRISQTGGIRDPHILRGGKNDDFYMVATDMFTVRDGWGSNPGIIMMRSDNLVDWEHSIIDLAKLYPEKFGNVHWVWAPQTFYDEKVKKYLVYFTVRYKDDDKLDFYAAYANKDFSGFEEEPQLIFSPKYGGIDGDIIYKDGLYHFFFKGNTKDENGKEVKNGIQQATSKSLKGSWKEDFKYIDAYADTSVVVEGSSIFKLNNSDEYILMYDLYADGRYEFQRSNDLFNFTQDPESFTKDFYPRHGSVIGVTRDEIRRLHEKWGGVPGSLTQSVDPGAHSQFQSEVRRSPKAILPGDYPDPTIVRDGKDYYMTHSPFYYMPGFLVWHSQDLVNWQPVGRVVPEYKGSAMAPDLIKHDGRFYLYFPSDGTNWVVWADDIRGPWSNPIDLEVGGIDPGHVVGEDGKRYLYVNDGRMIQLSDDGLSTVGELKKAYDGWEFPKHWETEGMWLESPKFIKKDGYFYQISAQGGTAGPPTSHMVVVARSKSVHGPWENSPYNPIVHTYSANDNWWSKGHGTLIDDVNGNWWIVYHAYANGYHTLGRQTLLEPVEWTADGWYRTKSTAQPIATEETIQHGLELSDDFSGSELGLQWTFWKEYAPETVTLKNNTLQLQAKGTTPVDARKLLTTVTDKSYETTVEIALENGNQAGLMLFYNEQAYAGIVSDRKVFKVHKDAETSFELPHQFGKRFFLKILNRGNSCTFSASKDGQNWTVLAENMDVSELHHNNYKGFYALRIALVSTGKGKAAFKNFKYKNAVPAEEDMSAYLMVFHKDDTHSLHIYAKQAGFRDTEWERDGETYGWGNNRNCCPSTRMKRYRPSMPTSPK